MDDPIDEYVIQQLRDYEKKPLQNIGKSGVKIPEMETDSQKKKAEERAETFKPLTEYLKKLLESSSVEQVVISTRLTESPCAVVASDYGMTPQMERMMKAQTFRNKEQQNMMRLLNKKVFEINPHHPLILAMLEKVKNGEESELEENAMVLYQSTLMRAGFLIEDSASLTTKIEKIIRRNLGVSDDAKLVDVDEEEEVVEEEAKPESENVEQVEEEDDLNRDEDDENEKVEAEPEFNPEDLNLDDDDDDSKVEHDEL